MELSSGHSAGTSGTAPLTGNRLSGSGYVRADIGSSFLSMLGPIARDDISRGPTDSTTSLLRLSHWANLFGFFDDSNLTAGLLRPLIRECAVSMSALTKGPRRNLLHVGDVPITIDRRRDSDASPFLFASLGALWCTDRSSTGEALKWWSGAPTFEKLFRIGLIRAGHCEIQRIRALGAESAVAALSLSRLESSEWCCPWGFLLGSGTSVHHWFALHIGVIEDEIEAEPQIRKQRRRDLTGGTLGSNEHLHQGTTLGQRSTIERSTERPNGGMGEQVSIESFTAAATISSPSAKGSTGKGARCTLRLEDGIVKTFKQTQRPFAAYKHLKQLFEMMADSGHREGLVKSGSVQVSAVHKQCDLTVRALCSSSERRYTHGYKAVSGLQGGVRSPKRSSKSSFPGLSAASIQLKPSDQITDELTANRWTQSIAGLQLISMLTWFVNRLANPQGGVHRRCLPTSCAEYFILVGVAVAACLPMLAWKEEWIEQIMNTESISLVNWRMILNLSPASCEQIMEKDTIRMQVQEVVQCFAISLRDGTREAKVGALNFSGLRESCEKAITQLMTRLHDSQSHLCGANRFHHALQDAFPEWWAALQSQNQLVGVDSRLASEQIIRDALQRLDRSRRNGSVRSAPPADQSIQGSVQSASMMLSRSIDTASVESAMDPEPRQDQSQHLRGHMLLQEAGSSTPDTGKAELDDTPRLPATAQESGPGQAGSGVISGDNGEVDGNSGQGGKAVSGTNESMLGSLLYSGVL